jgi:Raf kinase inhibitor-like YbhB/YbcL family protein
VIIAAFCLSQRPGKVKNEINSQNMKIRSFSFEDNQSIPKKYTCDGENISPSFQITDIPKETKSLLFIVDDPDALGETWNHWIVWNINPDTSLFEEGEIPEGSVEGINDSGKNSYYGPCPPSGTHYYHFKLFALGKTIENNPSFKKEEIEKLVKESIIGSAELVGTYEKK